MRYKKHILLKEHDSKSDSSPIKIQQATKIKRAVNIIVLMLKN